MASVTITVPDALVPQALAAFRRRYPDLTAAGLTDMALAREAVARMVRESLRTSEGDRVERDLQVQFRDARANALAAIADAVNQIV